MFIVMFFLLGLCFGYALGMPWALTAFLIPLGLILVATDRSPVAVVIGLAVTAIGIIAGLLLDARGSQQRHPVGGA
jgi:hypothetical protein